MLATGLRIGEALAVSWSDVDLEARTVEVDWKLIRTKGEGLRHVRRLRGGDDRTLPLPEFAVDMLRRRRARSSRPWAGVPGRARRLAGPEQHVTRPADRTRDGRLHLGDVSRVRKTCATILDEAGLSARAIADQLGHARPWMTQDVHMGRKVINPQTAAALDAALGKR
jgi:integrase